MAENILITCPVFGVPCVKELCTGYEVHTKQRFWNLKTEKYIPYDQLEFYKTMTPEELVLTVERRISIARECKILGKIIEIVNLTDHLIPTI